jgi:hypothetical protein
LDQPLQRHTDRIGKLRGGEARKQTEPPDNALKKHAALLCWQVASGSHDGGKLGIAEGEHLAAESLVAHPALWWVLCLTAVNSFWFPLTSVNPRQSKAAGSGERAGAIISNVDDRH